MIELTSVSPQLLEAHIATRLLILRRYLICSHLLAHQAKYCVTRRNIDMPPSRSYLNRGAKLFTNVYTRRLHFDTISASACERAGV